MITVSGRDLGRPPPSPALSRLKSQFTKFKAEIHVKIDFNYKKWKIQKITKLPQKFFQRQALSFLSSISSYSLYHIAAVLYQFISL